MTTRPVKLACFTLATVLACSSYKYIPPATFTYDGPVTDGVPYRPLTRADFQAQEPPDPVRGKIDALTAISCVVDSVFIFPIPEDGDSARWQTSLEKARFRAIMYPKKSWWNPKRTSKKDTQRLLEHEQTHFDIAELVVRRANARVQPIRAVAPTPAASIQKARELFDQEMATLGRSLQDWTAKYDLETKNGTDNREQKRWVELVRKELAMTDSL